MMLAILQTFVMEKPHKKTSSENVKILQKITSSNELTSQTSEVQEEYMQTQCLHHQRIRQIFYPPLTPIEKFTYLKGQTDGEAA